MFSNIYAQNFLFIILARVLYINILFFICLQFIMLPTFHPYLTHHPLQTVETAHLRGGMNGRHAIAGANIQRAARLQHEELEHLQVALLSGQINGRHVVVHLGVGAVVQRAKERETDKPTDKYNEI